VGDSNNESMFNTSNRSASIPSFIRGRAETKVSPTREKKGSESVANRTQQVPELKGPRKQWFSNNQLD
jgi:hypothetical protein